MLSPIHISRQAPHCYFAAQEVLTNATTCPDAPSQPRAIYHSMVKFADDVLGNLTAALRHANFDIILGRFSRVSRLHTARHAPPCALLYLVPMLMAC